MGWMFFIHQKWWLSLFPREEPLHLLQREANLRELSHSKDHPIFFERKSLQWGRENGIISTRGRSSDAQDWFSAELLGKNEHKENELRKPNVSKQANGNPFPLFAPSGHLADLVASARGGGGVKGRRGEGKRRGWRGSVVALCGIGTLGGSWWWQGQLNHLWQWSVRLRRCEEEDGSRP